MIVVENKEQLRELINQRVKEQGPDCDLNDIDVSKIDDMSGLFLHSKFIGDISEWDVSRVRSMNSMFTYSRFKGSISKWDVSNVEDMESISEDSPSLGYMWSSEMRGIE